MHWNYRLVINPKTEAIALRTVYYAEDGSVEGMDEGTPSLCLPLDWCEAGQTPLDLIRSELDRYQTALVLPILTIPSE